jgi:DNA-binding NarL/FixJ family response regulator
VGADLTTKSPRRFISAIGRVLRVQVAQRVRAVKSGVALLGAADAAFVEEVKTLLKPRFETIDTVSDGRALVAAAVRMRPDVVLLDVSLPGLNGIDAAIRINSEAPGAKLVFLSEHADPLYRSGAVAAGAHAYVLKSCAGKELAAAIQQVLRGGTYGIPEQPEVVCRRTRSPFQSIRELSVRELEVLRLLAKAKSAKDIAVSLRISPRTVVFHKSSLMRKMGVRTTAELIVLAIRGGMVNER